MGLFDRMFGGRKDYPALDSGSPAAGCLAKYRAQIEALADEVHKPLEVIPDKEGAYVFIGKPPKHFGIAWIEGDRVMSFKTLVEERGIDPATLQPLAEKLREIYEANLGDERYSAKVGEQQVVVTPSEDFLQQVREVIQSAAH